MKGEAAPASWDHYRDTVGEGLRAADLIIAPSRAMMAALRKFYGPLPATRVIANGRDVAQYAPAVKEPFILTAGRLWDEAKNVSAIAEIAPRLPWPVFVAGDVQPPAGTSPCSLTGGEGGGQGVRSLGRLDEAELAGWMGRAAIYALPAKYEPFGLSALEAASSGCALVLGDIPSLREIWGDAATFIAPYDPAALRSALVELIDSPAKRLEMARRAIERAARFYPHRMAASYLSAYRELASRAAFPAVIESNTSAATRECTA